MDPRTFVSALHSEVSRYLLPELASVVLGFVIDNFPVSVTSSHVFSPTTARIEPLCALTECDLILSQECEATTDSPLAVTYLGCFCSRSARLFQCSAQDVVRAALAALPLPCGHLATLCINIADSRERTQFILWEINSGCPQQIFRQNLSVDYDHMQLLPQPSASSHRSSCPSRPCALCCGCVSSAVVLGHPEGLTEVWQIQCLRTCSVEADRTPGPAAFSCFGIRPSSGHMITTLSKFDASCYFRASLAIPSLDLHYTVLNSGQLLLCAMPSAQQPLPKGYFALLDPQYSDHSQHRHLFESVLAACGSPDLPMDPSQLDHVSAGPSRADWQLRAADSFDSQSATHSANTAELFTCAGGVNVCLATLSGGARSCLTLRSVLGPAASKPVLTIQLDETDPITHIAALSHCRGGDDALCACCLSPDCTDSKSASRSRVLSAMPYRAEGRVITESVSGAVQIWRVADHSDCLELQCLQSIDSAALSLGLFAVPSAVSVFSPSVTTSSSGLSPSPSPPLSPSGGGLGPSSGSRMDLDDDSTDRGPSSPSGSEVDRSVISELVLSPLGTTLFVISSVRMPSRAPSPAGVAAMNQDSAAFEEPELGYLVRLTVASSPAFA